MLGDVAIYRDGWGVYGSDLKLPVEDVVRLHEDRRDDECRQQDAGEDEVGVRWALRERSVPDYSGYGLYDVPGRELRREAYQIIKRR